MEKEIWKDVVGFEGLYQISSHGRVKRKTRIITDSLNRKKLIKELYMQVKVCKKTGYPYTSISKNGICKKVFIHRLIAEAFIPNPDNLPCVNHIDQDRGNSILSNLEWCTYSYNNSYGDANKKRKESLRGTLTGKHKIIYQYKLDGELVRCFVHGVNQFEELLGYSIQDSLTGKSKTSHGYVFSYRNTFSYEPNKKASHQKYVYLIDETGSVISKYDSVSQAGIANGFDRHEFSRNNAIDGIVTIKGKRFVVEKKEDEYIPKGHKGPRPDLKGKGAKPVCQYTKDGEYIAEYPSITDAVSELGLSGANPEISNCCNGKLKTARGFIWRYKGSPIPKPFKNDSIKPVEQYSFEGKYLATYDSIVDAARAVNGKPGSIQNNVSGRSHSAYGYYWKYKK